MAYVNVTSEGAKPSGPFLKRAEKDLIMRRGGGYRNHQDSLNRVAVIYGGPHGYGPEKMIGPEGPRGYYEKFGSHAYNSPYIDGNMPRYPGSLNMRGRKGVVDE
jgi:hypothetical protein